MRHFLALLLLIPFFACSRGGGGSTTSVPSSPSKPAATLVNNRVQLSWSAAASGLPDGYKVEQSQDNTSSFSQVLVTTETSTFVDGLASGHTYFFRVRSFNGSGNSAYSGNVSVSL